MGKWTRRAVIGAGGLLGGGLVLGIGGVALAPNRLRYVPADKGPFEYLTTWIKVTPRNEVVAIVPHCEMGQGAVTGVAMMLAEELEADWDLVRIEEAPPEDIYANGYVLRGFAEEAGLEVPSWLERAIDFGTFKFADMAGLQITGGSSSTRSTGQFGMRVAGAAAKTMLLEAAARQWDVAIDQCRARDSRVLHAASKRSATYGELASAAAMLAPPQHPALKPRSEYRIVGKSKPRADIPSKVDGRAIFGIDMAVPGMRYATIAAAPVPGGRLQRVDPAPAKALPGVTAVVELEDAVAVVADGYWQALQGLRALAPEFTTGGMGAVDSQQVVAAHRAALDALDGDAAPAAANEIAVEYRVPYLAHAAMEPLCATARVAEGRAEVWAGTQDPLNARRIAAAAAELEPEQVVMHNLPLGGGFGRRLPGAFDYIEQAVRVARAVSPMPVKLIWSREEDMQHDYYRPLVVARMQSALGADGSPRSWRSSFTGSRLMDTMAATPIYPVPETEIRVADPPVHLRTGSWRSVASSQHGFFMESFVDELAHAAGQDPFQYRRALLATKPRHRSVLEQAAEMADWGGPLAEGRARGIAIVECFGSVVAEVAEVGIASSGDIRVHRVDAAVDCGYAVNPDQALAQVQGAILFGLSSALFHEITVGDGKVVQRSFPDYDMVRLANAPRVNVAFVDSGAALGGLGEPGVPPIAPAVANAIFVLTGRRLRELPLRV